MSEVVGSPSNTSSSPGEGRVRGPITRTQSRLTESLHRLSQLAVGERELTETFTGIASCAVLAAPHAEGAGLTYVGVDGSETLVASTGFVAEVDSVQYRLREGPCITATREAKTVMSSSLSDDDRWPEFGPRVATLGVHSALSLPLVYRDRVVRAMNIYARSTCAFDESDVDVGEHFAGPAVVTVLNAELFARTRLLVTRLQSAVKQRRIIDQAIGILVGRQGITADEALERLLTFSRKHQLALGDVADVTVDRATRHPR